MKPARISSCLLALIAIAVLTSSCGSPSSELTPPTAPTESTESAAPIETTPTAPESAVSQTNRANLPDQVANQVKSAIAQTANVSAETIQIANAESQTWPDGCFGLANPGEFCTQALVEGWRIEATDGETTWFYRTDATGSQMRSES